MGPPSFATANTFATPAKQAPPTNATATNPTNNFSFPHHQQQQQQQQQAPPTMSFQPLTTPLPAPRTTVTDTPTTSIPTLLRQPTLESGTSGPSVASASGTTATSSRMLRRPTLESGAGPSMPGPTTSVPPSTLPTLPFVSEEHEDSEVRQVTTGANDGQLLQNENGLFAAPRSFGVPPPMDTLSSGLQPNGPPSQQPSQQPTLQPTLQPNLQHSYSQESLRSSNGSFHDTGLSGGGKCHACFLSTESRAHAHPFPVFLCLLSLSLSRPPIHQQQAPHVAVFQRVQRQQ